MKIEGMGNRYAFGHQREKTVRTEVDNNDIGRQTQTKNSVREEEQVTVEPRRHEGQAHGAIRNIQEAHFQGVASLRMHINFHERLQMEAQQNAVTTLAESSDTLMSDLEDQLLSFGGGFQSNDMTTGISGEIEELMNSFSSAIDTLFTGSETDQQSPTSILTGIGVAFDEFFASLSQMGQQASAESADTEEIMPEDVAAIELDQLPDETAAVVTETEENMVAATDVQENIGETEAIEEPATFESQLQTLRAWFNDQMEAMQTNIDNLMQLQPPAGKPRGNGVAYSRFLAIYNEMSAVTTTTSNGTFTDSGLETEA